MKNLDELFTRMKNNDPALPSWDSLPTFGGVDPANTAEIWSWDKTQLIVGTCSNDIEIVDRCDHFFVSLDNGNTFDTVEDLTDEQIDDAWDALVTMMDNDAREMANTEVAPCSNRDFLVRYMQLAPDNLII